MTEAEIGVACLQAKAYWPEPGARSQENGLEQSLPQGLQKKPDLSAPRFWPSGFSHGVRLNGCGCKPPRLWYLVTTAPRNYNRDQNSQRSELEGEAKPLISETGQ